MKVIIGIEDPIYGEAIVNFVATQKWSPGTSFEFVHILDREPTGELVSEFCCPTAADLIEQEKTVAKELLVEMELKLLKLIPDAVTEQKLINGRPKEKLLEEVENQKADLLIVGSHGRTGFTRFLMGSVSMAVLSQAPCSVLIVKLPHKAKPTAAQDCSAEQKTNAPIASGTTTK